MPLSRRALLAGLGAGAFAAPLVSATATELSQWMRLAGALDDRLVIWWMEGFRYGVRDGVSRYLHGMQVGIFQRFFARPDGDWDIAMFELTYYTDPATGRLLEYFDNPYTGRRTAVRQVRLGPEIRLQTAAGQFPDRADPVISRAITRYSASLGPATVLGDRVWLPTAVEGEIRPAGDRGPVIRLNHYTTASGALEASLDTSVLSAPCELAFQNVLDWEPWMQMQGAPGHLMSRAWGCKLTSPAQLPGPYLALAQQVHPQLIADPVQTLEPAVARILSRR